MSQHPPNPSLWPKITHVLDANGNEIPIEVAAYGEQRGRELLAQRAARYPSYANTPAVTVRMPAAEKTALEALAARLGVSVSDVVRARLSAAGKPISALDPLEVKAELEALRAEAAAQLTPIEARQAEQIKDPAHRGRFICRCNRLRAAEAARRK